MSLPQPNTMLSAKGGRHYCEFCETYIQDNKASRSHHEQSRKHHFRKEAFLARIYKRQERKQREEARNTRLLDQMNRGAGISFAHDDAQQNTNAIKISSAIQSASYGRSASTNTEVSINPPEKVIIPFDQARGIAKVEMSPPIPEIMKSTDIGSASEFQDKISALAASENERKKIQSFVITKKTFENDSDFGDEEEGGEVLFKKRKKNNNLRK